MRQRHVRGFDAVVFGNQLVVAAESAPAPLYYAAEYRAYVLTGLPEKPAHVSMSDLSSTDAVNHLAVSNGGELVVLSAESRQGENLYRWSAASSGLHLLGYVVSVGDIAITADGSAIVADRSSNEVFAIRDAAGAAVRQFLIGPQDGVSDPAVVMVSAANRIHVANAGSDSVTTLDSSGRVLKSQTCTCNITGAQRLKDSVLRLTIC
jgi:hypothetical protein